MSSGWRKKKSSENYTTSTLRVGVSKGKHIDDTKTDEIVTIEVDEKIFQDNFLPLKLEMEANLHKQEIKGLADEIFLRGVKFFSLFILKL